MHWAFLPYQHHTMSILKPTKHDYVHDHTTDSHTNDPLPSDPLSSDEEELQSDEKEELTSNDGGEVTSSDWENQTSSEEEEADSSDDEIPLNADLKKLTTEAEKKKFILDLLESADGDLALVIDNFYDCSEFFQWNRWRNDKRNSSILTYQLLEILDEYEIPFEKAGIYFNSNSPGLGSYLPNWLQTLFGIENPDPLAQPKRQEVFEWFKMLFYHSILINHTTGVTRDDVTENMFIYADSARVGYFDHVISVRNRSVPWGATLDQLVELIYPKLEIKIKKFSDPESSYLSRWFYQTSLNCLPGIYIYLMMKHGWILNPDVFLEISETS